MSRPLLHYARMLIGGSAGPLVQGPVFVWDPGDRLVQHLSDTIPTADEGFTRYPKAGSPLVLELPSTKEEAGDVNLGRTEGNDLLVENPSVSRLHVVLNCDARGQQWFVTDANSRNGTSINGVRLKPYQPKPLADGDMLAIGDVALLFLLPSSFAAYVKKRLDEAH